MSCVKLGLILMIVSGFSFEVLVRGRAISEYLHDGLVWVEGRSGSMFDLSFVSSVGRVEVILSVDGLSVLDGLPAGYGSCGYVVDRDLRLSGYVFGDRRMGGNVGVIGCLVFDDGDVGGDYVRGREIAMMVINYDGSRGLRKRGIRIVRGGRVDLDYVPTAFPGLV